MNVLILIADHPNYYEFTADGRALMPYIVALPLSPLVLSSVVFEQNKGVDLQ